MIRYLRVSEVAHILQWRADKTRRWLKAAGALVQRGGRAVTTPEILKTCFPEVYQDIVDSGYDSEKDEFEA